MWSFKRHTSLIYWHTCNQSCQFDYKKGPWLTTIGSIYLILTFLFHPLCICIPSPSFILRGKRWELWRSERSGSSERSADANLIDFILRQTAWLMITALCVNNSTEERSQDFTENATDYFRYIRASISSSCFIPSLRSLLISAANGDIKRSPVVKRLAHNWIIPQSENVWKRRVHSHFQGLAGKCDCDVFTNY